MKIAVVGAGVSGNLIARLLSRDHDVQLFEANDYAGGHTNTVEFEAWGRSWRVDTGFMVCNDRTYPSFIRLLSLLGIDSQDSEMSFSVRCERSGLEYEGGSLNGLFAQRSNLLRPSFHRMLWDILRFNRQSPEMLAEDAPQLTLGEYLDQRRYRREFVDHYLVPMTAAIWSARPRSVLEFPARFLVGFFQNHGLLQLRDRPVWKTIPGGAQRYVRALLQPLEGSVRLNSPVESIERRDDRVLVVPRGGPAESFDHVVCAAHADQALSMLRDADAREREILGSFPYQRNEVLLHTDTRLLPCRRRAWASWNYHVDRDPDCPVAVTYDVSRLQRIDSPQPLLVTLNAGGRIDPARVLRRLTYDHPAYELKSIDAQRRHAEISGRRRTHFCGAYWRHGFHEDGVCSALAVGKFFGVDLSACTAATTEAASGTAGTNR